MKKVAEIEAFETARKILATAIKDEVDAEKRDTDDAAKHATRALLLQAKLDALFEDGVLDLRVPEGWSTPEQTAAMREELSTARATLAAREGDNFRLREELKNTRETFFKADENIVHMNKSSYETMLEQQREQQAAIASLQGILDSTRTDLGAVERDLAVSEDENRRLREVIVRFEQERDTRFEERDSKTLRSRILRKASGVIVALLQ